MRTSRWKVQNSLSFVNESVNWVGECVNWMDGRVNERTDGWINKWEVCLCVNLHTHILRGSYFMSSSAFYSSYSNICCYSVSLVCFITQSFPHLDLRVPVCLRRTIRANSHTRSVTSWRLQALLGASKIRRASAGSKLAFTAQQATVSEEIKVIYVHLKNYTVTLWIWGHLWLKQIKEASFEKYWGHYIGLSCVLRTCFFIEWTCPSSCFGMIFIMIYLQGLFKIMQTNYGITLFYSPVTQCTYTLKHAF